MVIDPKYGFWLSIITAIGSALVLCGDQFTTIFGTAGSSKALAILAIVNAVVNAGNAVLHAIPSSAPTNPTDAAKFLLGPKT